VAQLRLRQALDQSPTVVAQAQLSADLSASRPSAVVQRMYQDPSEKASKEDVKGRLEAGLRKRYGNIKEDVLQALVSAKLTLMDREYSEDKLLELQGKMESSGQDLDTVLSQEEEANQFAPRQVVSDLLSPDKFQELLRSRSQMFDTGTPSEHGPHTHRLQWSILYKAAAEGKLPMKPVDLYEQLGNPALKDPSADYRTVWDDVFDFDAEAADLIGAKSLEPNKQREKAAYSSPEWTLAHLAREGGPLKGGPLEQQLRRDRSVMNELGGGALLDLKGALIDKIVIKEMVKELLPMDLSAKQEREETLRTKEVAELRELYQQLQS